MVRGGSDTSKLRAVGRAGIGRIAYALLEPRDGATYNKAFSTANRAAALRVVTPSLEKML